MLGKTSHLPFTSSLLPLSPHRSAARGPRAPAGPRAGRSFPATRLTHPGEGWECGKWDSRPICTTRKSRSFAKHVRPVLWSGSGLRGVSPGPWRSGDLGLPQSKDPVAPLAPAGERRAPGSRDPWGAGLPSCGRAGPGSRQGTFRRWRSLHAWRGSGWRTVASVKTRGGEQQPSWRGQRSSNFLVSGPLHTCKKLLRTLKTFCYLSSILFRNYNGEVFSKWCISFF